MGMKLGVSYYETHHRLRVIENRMLRKLLGLTGSNWRLEKTA
jgi:hypothetical protein